MKKIFAVFCSLCLIPSFSAHAWIGGPFSNNSYSSSGDDGLYEAVAIPVNNRANPNQAIKNGIGIYRWAVTNNANFRPEAGVTGITSNLYFGGVGQTTHTWFIEGVAYRGTCEGTANSGLGVVHCLGNATEVITGLGIIETSFKGKFSSSGNGGDGIPISRFSAKGRGTAISLVNQLAPVAFRFRVFGSKVTTSVNYNGISN